MTIKLLKPAGISRGDRVSLIAPAGPVEEGRAAAAVDYLTRKGLEVVVREDISQRDGFLAGSDERRLGELRDALFDPLINAVFLARGGYGVQRILEGLGELAPPDPKPVVGFSDNTALLALLRNRWGWATLHGPHHEFDNDIEMDRVLGCIGYDGERSKPSFSGLKSLNDRTGQVTAEVCGGCLSILSTSIGTGWGVKSDGRILFIEEVGEYPYRIDRMLNHLLSSGVAGSAAGIVFGEVDGFVPEQAGPEGRAKALEVAEDFASRIETPVVCGLPCGHVDDHHPLPLGIEATLDPVAGTLEFMESLVR